MAISPLYRFFKEHSCVEVGLFVILKIPNATFTKIRGCLEGKRKNLPYGFAEEHASASKERIAATARLARVAQKESYELTLRWFRTDLAPPDEFGKLENLKGCLEKLFGERQVWSCSRQN